MIYIRADGNTNIGMGHVMRCLSIADAILEKGEKPVFILARMLGTDEKDSTDKCVEMINNRGFETVVLDTDYREMEREIMQLSEIVENKEDSVILVDSYQVTVKYYNELRKFAKVVCLEDMGYSYPVDLLINYNIYAPELENKYTGCEVKVRPDKTLLGIKYQPLRKGFCNDNTSEQKFFLKNNISDIMLTTGGSDPNYVAGAILNTVLSDSQFDNITVHVISGPFNSNADRMKDEYKNISNVIIYEGLSDLKPVMNKCDVVITATGSTIYEVSALGIPFISFYYAENQRQGAEAFAKLTEVVNAGCYNLENADADNQKVIDNIENALKRCIADKEYRERLSLQEKALVDGKGASRIAEAIIELERR